MSLIDLITGNAGQQVAQEAENNYGVSKTQIIALLAVAAPLIISYLRNKSQDAEQAEGGSILDHIFGGQKATVETNFHKTLVFLWTKLGQF